MAPEEEERRILAAGMATAEKLRRKAIVACSDEVSSRLKEPAKGLDLDELVVVTWTYGPAPRQHSYELLAEAFALEKTEPYSM